MTPISTLRFGAVFKTRREELNLTIRQVERATGIRQEYLEAIERSDFTALPRKVYLERMLKKYCNYLDVPFAVIEKLWAREQEKKRSRATMPGARAVKQEESVFKYLFLSPTKKLPFLFTPKLLFTIASLAGLGILLTYFFFLYASISSAPKLDILEPNDNITVRSDNVVAEGFTEPGNVTTINGKEIAVNPQGYFKELIGLNSGVNKIYIQTIGGNGRVSIAERTIIAEIDTGKENETALTKQKYDSLEIKLVAKEAVWLRAITDDKKTVEMILNPPNEKVFKAEENITFKFGNAGGVTVYVNGVKQEPLGATGEVLEKTYRLSELNAPTE